MSQHTICKYICLSVAVVLLLSSCGGSSGVSPGTTASKSASAAQTDTSKSQSASSGKGAWDNTPKVLVPTQPGTTMYGNDAVLIDASNMTEGYISVSYRGQSDKIKIFVVTPDQTRYAYDLDVSEGWSTLPLTGGNGTYTFDVREHVQDDLYSNLYSTTAEVTLADEFRPFLYPNQFTWFTADSTTVAKASELAAGADTGLDVITGVYDYVIKNITYDSPKAENIQSGYLPDIDQTLATGTGICFDYAAVMTAMLRSQGIPTKLEIGYSGETYHAWISTWLAETGWVENVIEFDGKNWSLIDPTLAATNKASSVKKYVGDGSHYTVKFSR